MDLIILIATIILPFAILIFSAILHEIAHGIVAEKLGDPTARLRGRITLNPKSHIDIWMTIIIPLLLIISHSPVIFGGAKPVPVDPFNLRDPKKDMALISLAGPGTNLIIAVIFSIIAHIIYPGYSLFQIQASGLIGLSIGFFITYNLMLAVFNLIPIPPLDGSKIFAMLLPADLERTYLSLSNFGFFILFFLLMPFSPIPLGHIISNAINFLLQILGF